MTDKVSISVPVLPSQTQTQTDGQSTVIRLARKLYYQSLAVLIQNPAIIPMAVINNLMLVANLGIDIKMEQLLRELIPAHIPAPLKLKILDRFSNINNGAAYELAQAYMGAGHFAQKKIDHSAALKYFHRAIRLNYKLAFDRFLNAICEGYLKLNTKQFIDTCKDLILIHGKVEVAHTLGALMCGYTITQRPELNNLFELQNPNQGYIYLEYVVQRGNQDLRKIAAENIVYGLDRGLFTNPDALTFIKRYNITRPITAQPTAGVTMKR
jgi:hypothetical protein